MNTVMKLEGGIKEVYYCDIELITKVPTTTIDNFAERIKHLDFARHASIITDDEFRYDIELSNTNYNHLLN